MTMQLIETVTVGSAGVASIAFENIPQTGTDLILKYSLRISSASISDSNSLKINGNDSNQYSRELRLNSSTGASSSNGISVSIIVNADNSSPDTFGSGDIYISNYATGSPVKPISIDQVTENKGSTSSLRFTAGAYNSTNAVTSLAFVFGGKTILENSTASIYMIS